MFRVLEQQQEASAIARWQWLLVRDLRRQLRPQAWFPNWRKGYLHIWGPDANSQGG
jgi:hypothetical protein